MKSLYINISLLLCVVALLSSCSVGKNYKRPEVVLPPQYINTVGVFDTTSIADIKWKDFFTEPTLQKLIDSAVLNNYDMQVAIKRIDATKEYLKQAKVSYFPDLAVQMGASISAPSKNSLNGLSLGSFLGAQHVEDYTAALGLSWEIDIWGKLRRQTESARANYIQSQEMARAVQTQLVANVATSYFNLLMLDKQMEIARRNINLNDSVVRVLRLQKDAGEVTQLAVQQAEVQSLNAQILIPQLEQAISIQETALRMLTSSMPGKVERAAGIDQYKVPDTLSAGVPAILLSRRPDVRASEQALISANALVGAAQARMYPALSITGSAGLNAFKVSDWFNFPNSLFGMVAGNLLQPLFQHRQLKTQFRVAKITREQRVIEFKQSILNAVGEVSNAQITLTKTNEQQIIARAQVDTLQKAVQNAQLLFRSGLANYLEVITAESNALQAELRLADIERQHLSGMVELYRSLGGGW